MAECTHPVDDFMPCAICERSAGDDVTAAYLCGRCNQPLPDDEPCFQMSNGTFTHIVCTLPTTAVDR